METSTGGGGGGLKPGAPGNDSNNNDSSCNNNNNNGNSSMLKIRQFTSSSSSSPPLHLSGHEQLTELTSSEISLDLGGLMDDTQFGEENIFGDLMEGKKSELIHNPYGGPHLLHGNNTTANNQAPNHHSHHHNSSIHHSLSQAHHNHHHHNIQRTSPTNSLGGSSGVSSPGTGETESYYANGNRQTLAYVPGSVHQASYAPPMQQGNVRVKQEPSDGDYARGYNAQNNNNNNNSAPYSNGTVSSTTPSPPSGLYMPGAQGLKVLSSSNSSHLPSSNKYIHPSLGTKKKTAIGVRCSDEYRRRRERNNVAVRKSREKAKIRTRETEERVKILARENERLTKKVELLQEELSVLRSLFSNVGVLPDHIHRELSKHMDSFQAQHNAMAATGNM